MSLDVYILDDAACDDAPGVSPVCSFELEVIQGFIRDDLVDPKEFPQLGRLCDYFSDTVISSSDIPKLMSEVSMLMARFDQRTKPAQLLHALYKGCVEAIEVGSIIKTFCD